MRSSPFALATWIVATVSSSACIQIGDPVDAGTDAGTSDGGTTACGSETCGGTQICLYRECSVKDRCRPSATCPAGTTPSDCDGQPGCLYPSCNPVVQGCRAIPESCGGDVTCACGSICGSPSACASVDGRNGLCKAQ